MSEQKKISIMIFQAPYASLMERGLYLNMHDPDTPFRGTVPAEYYLPSFNGEIECPQELPEDQELRTRTILEHIYTTFNLAHPAGYCGRSLSVGDVVKLEGHYYLCAPFGFEQVTFQASPEHPGVNPTVCPLPLPNETSLRVTVCKEAHYPGVNIELVTADGMESRVCFAEYNPTKLPGYELCVGVYCATKENPVYYDSYGRDQEESRNN